MKIQHFARFLKQLADSCSKFDVQTVEIVFVVDFDKNMKSFVIYPVEGEGLMKEYGWLKGEEKEKVTVLGMKGFMQI